MLTKAPPFVVLRLAEERRRELLKSVGERPRDSGRPRPSWPLHPVLRSGPSRFSPRARPSRSDGARNEVFITVRRFWQKIFA